MKQKNSDIIESARILFWGFMAVMLTALVFTFLGSLVASEDTNRWEKVDSEGDCYLLIESKKNLWFTPGEDIENRIIYCKSEMEK